MSCASLEDFGLEAEYGVPGTVWGAVVRCLGGIVDGSERERATGRQWAELSWLVVNLLELQARTYAR